MFGRKKSPPDYRWWNLATYNAEVSRGIVHTDAWKARMRREQDIFDAEQRRHVNVGPPPPPLPDLIIEPAEEP